MYSYIYVQMGRYTCQNHSNMGIFAALGSCGYSTVAFSSATCTHTHTHTHTQSHTHTHTYSLSLSLSLSLSHARTHARTRARAHTHTHTVTHKVTHSQTPARPPPPPSTPTHLYLGHAADEQFELILVKVFERAWWYDGIETLGHRV
jgi:hypothetical protein